MELIEGDFWNNSNDSSNYTTPLLEMFNVTKSPRKIMTPRCLLFKLLLHGAFCGILCILGFIGNIVSFLVLRKDRSTPVASFLLQSLAIADNLLLVLWIIHYTVRDIFRYTEFTEADDNTIWAYTLVYTFPMLYMAQTETIWLTVVVALNRFMAVCLPYRAPHLCNIGNVYKEVAVVTLFSIIYNVPRFFEVRVREPQPNGKRWYRTDIGKNEVYETVYMDALYYIFSFVLPLLILVCVNTRVTIAYHASRQRRRRMMSRRSENENNITLVMIIVVLVFMLTQAPARIVQLVWSYRFEHCEQFRFFLIHISNTLEVLNSSVNFLIYFLFHKRFRDILWSHYCCRSLAMRYGPASQRSLTTEELSFAERNITRKSSKSKSNSSQRNGSVPSIHGTVPSIQGSVHNIAEADNSQLQTPHSAQPKPSEDGDCNSELLLRPNDDIVENSADV